MKIIFICLLVVKNTIFYFYNLKKIVDLRSIFLIKPMFACFFYKYCLLIAAIFFNYIQITDVVKGATFFGLLNYILIT